MKRSVMSAIFALSLGSQSLLPVAAQQPPTGTITAETLFTEAALEKWLDRELEAGERHCGDYFVLHNLGNTGTMVLKSIFVVYTTRGVITVHHAHHKDEYYITIDDRALKPTITLDPTLPQIRVGNELFPRIALKISVKDYEAAKDCLPPPDRIDRIIVVGPPLDIGKPQ